MAKVFKKQLKEWKSSKHSYFLEELYYLWEEWNDKKYIICRHFVTQIERGEDEDTSWYK